MYYTDARKALWMLEEYSVKLFKEHCPDIPVTPRCLCEDILEGSYDAKYHVHPDSKEIFEPQEGDVVQYKFGGQPDFYTDSFTDCVGGGFDYTFLDKCDYWFLVKRDNKAFFTPEVEE